ncbi:hypothetical protein ACU4GH_22850 [Bradyrhizobium betae]
MAADPAFARTPRFMGPRAGSRRLLAPAVAQQVEPPARQKKLPEAPPKLPKVDRKRWDRNSRSV